MTTTGKHWLTAVLACALLGVSFGAIAVLESVPPETGGIAWYYNGQPYPSADAACAATIWTVYDCAATGAVPVPNMPNTMGCTGVCPSIVPANSPPFFYYRPNSSTPYPTADAACAAIQAASYNALPYILDMTDPTAPICSVRNAAGFWFFSGRLDYIGSKSLTPTIQWSPIPYTVTAVCPAAIPAYTYKPASGMCEREVACLAPSEINPSTGQCISPCPVHASGIPCVCDAGYQFDAAGTNCVPVVACPVDKLAAPPFNDACAEVLENIHSTQAQKDAACGALTPALLAGKTCFEGKLAGISPAIPMKITGDIRNIAYQAHLREIWDKMEKLVALENDPVKRTACTARRAEIAAEKGCDKAGPCKSEPNEVCYPESSTQRSHCLKGRPAKPSPNDAQHTQGNAFDVSEDYTITPLQDALDARNPPQTIPQFLDAPTDCNLIWGGTFKTNKDSVHFLAR